MPLFDRKKPAIPKATPQLLDFLALAKSLVASSTMAAKDRIYYSNKQNKPVSAGLFKRGGLIGPNFWAENAQVVNFFERAIIEQAKCPEQNITMGLWYLSKFHQGSSPLFARDVINVFRLLNANEKQLTTYFMMQQAADIISEDPAFEFIVKGIDDNFVKKFIKNTLYQGDYLALLYGADRSETVSPWSLSAEAKDKLKVAGNLGDQFVLGFILPPAVIVKRMYDICAKTESVSACATVSKIAKKLGSPLAFQLAETLHNKRASELNSIGFNLTFTVVGTGVGAAFGGVGGALGLGGNALTAVASKLAAADLTLGLTIFKYLFTAGKTVAGIALPKVMDLQFFSGNKQLYDFEDAILPIFHVRRSPRDSSEASGRDSIYSFYDFEGAMSLLLYLGVPQQPVKRFIHRDWSERKVKMWAQLRARIILKNMLGSYTSEDCLRDISYGMSPEEYIAEALGQTTTDPSQMKIEGVGIGAEKRSSTKRPVSFLRLLCVATGLAGNHTVSAEDRKAGKGRVWDGLAPNQPGQRFVSQIKGQTMKGIFSSGELESTADWRSRDNQVWRDPQEAEVRFMSVNESTYPLHLYNEYTVVPIMKDDYISGLVSGNTYLSDTTLPIRATKIPDFTGMVLSAKFQNRWVRDSEEPNCHTCSTVLKDSSRQHCWYCGHAFCKTHCSQHLNLINPESGLQTTYAACANCVSFYNGLIASKSRLPGSGEKSGSSFNVLEETLHDDITPQSTATINGTVLNDHLALKRGGAIVRPQYVKWKSTQPVLGEE